MSLRDCASSEFTRFTLLSPALSTPEGGTSVQGGIQSLTLLTESVSLPQ